MPQSPFLLLLRTFLPYLLCVCLGGAGSWVWQANSYETKLAKLERDHARQEAEHAKEDAQQAKKNLDTFVQMQRKTDEAVKSAEARAAANRAAAASAAAVSTGLRDELTKARSKIATSTCESVTNYATALSDVFDQCQSRYSDLAEKATGHASDVQTLIDAWPTTPAVEKDAP